MRMLSNIGVPGLILILVLALIIFGPKRLPEMGRAVGQTLKEFKKSANELVNSDDNGKATKVEATKIDEDKK
jgi:sec-independent protein translocase protein TatA